MAHWEWLARLRVVVITDQARHGAATRNLVRNCLRAMHAELTGVLLLDGGRSAAAESLFDSLAAADALLHGEIPRELMPLAEHFSVSATGGLAATVKNGRLLPGTEALHQLRQMSADVVLCLTCHPLELPADAARLGAFGIEVGQGVSLLASWAGAAEMVGRQVLPLRIVDYCGGRRECYGACISTAGTASLHGLRQDLLARSAGLLRRHLARLAAGKDDAALPRLLEAQAAPAAAADTDPSVQLWLGVLAETARRWLHHRLPGGRGKGNSWHLAYAFTDQALPDIPYPQLRYLAPARGTFWADPFPLIHEGRHYIFFEEMPDDGPHGRLLAIEVTEDGPPGPPLPVLTRPHHLSYPQVFHWQGGLYMVPETRQAGRIELLRCVEFPGRWESCAILLEDIRAVDATLWQEGGQWWLFAQIAPEGSQTADELHLFYADSPLGDWVPHPANPLCADIRCSRPAGGLFQSGGALYRPSQDGGDGYGTGIWLNRIERLDRQGYRERAVQRIGAEWHPAVSRVHTLGRAGRLTVLDCVVAADGGIAAEQTGSPRRGQV